MIKIQNNLISVTWRGHVYAETVTGYTRDGVRITLSELPLQVRYLMAVEQVGEAPL